MILPTRRLLAGVFFALWLAFQTWGAQRLFFDDNLIFYGFLAFFFSWVFWLAVSWLPRFVVVLLLIVFTLLQAGLTFYHHYFQDPLTLRVMWHQWREAGVFLLKTPSLWGDVRIWSILLLGAADICIYWRLAPLLRSLRVLPAAALFSLGVFAVFLIYTPESLFDKNYFQMTCRNFGYGFCWGYEAVNGRNRTAALEVLRANAEKLPPASLPENYRRPPHIYLIQVESLAWDIIGKTWEGREITPFLNSLSQTVPFYRVTGKPEGASSNADFAVNAGTFSLQDYGAVYRLYEPEELYRGFALLPRLAEAKGYRPVFFHNFAGDFYNRRPHIIAQGYYQVFFYDDMLDQNGQLEVEDGEMFAFIRRYHQNRPREKIFDYIITVSSHADYKVRGNTRPLIAEPQSEKEDYFNAVNYVDRVLEDFISSLPKDSLVLIYGDHGIVDFAYDGAAFLIYDRLNNPPAENRVMPFAEFVARVRAYLQ